MLLSDQETRPEEMLFPTRAGEKREEWREAGVGWGLRRQVGPILLNFLSSFLNLPGASTRRGL